MDLSTLRVKKIKPDTEPKDRLFKLSKVNDIKIQLIKNRIKLTAKYNLLVKPQIKIKGHYEFLQEAKKIIIHIKDAKIAGFIPAKKIVLTMLKSLIRDQYVYASGDKIIVQL